MRRALVPGFRFKEGKLFVFTDDYGLSIDGWTELTAVRREASGGGWQSFVPRFRLLKPRSSSVVDGVNTDLGPKKVVGRTVHAEFERVTAFRGFRHTLPPEVASACERFPGRQWRVLRLCSVGEEAVELVRSSPALGFALAHQAALRTDGVELSKALRKMAMAKQRAVLEWLEFPGTEASVRIFRKIPVESLDLDRLRKLRIAMRRTDVLQLLAHVSKINKGVQTLVSDPFLCEWVSPKFLEEVAGFGDEAVQLDAVNLLTDFVELLPRLGGWLCPNTFESVQRLREVSHEATEEYCRRAREKAERLAQPPPPFPPPPLPGTEFIVPLTTSEQLQEEGREQSNCAGTFSDKVRSKDCYLYRVMQPERATLSIAKGSDGNWHIRQLKIKANQEARVDTAIEVETWLRRYSLSV